MRETGEVVELLKLMKLVKFFKLCESDKVRYRGLLYCFLDSEKLAPSSFELVNGLVTLTVFQCLPQSMSIVSYILHSLSKEETAVTHSAVSFFFQRLRLDVESCNYIAGGALHMNYPWFGKQWILAKRSQCIFPSQDSALLLFLLLLVLHPGHS